MNGHIALLGDSILDNGAYNDGGPDVVTHVRAMLPDGWRAALLALDGSLIADLEGQLSDLPADTNHIVVSIGGNNVLMNLEILRLRVRSEPEALGFSGEEAAAALVILTTFNDAILRVAFEARLRVIELRLVCTEPADYANAIEASVLGGEKIARAITRALGLAVPTAEAGRIYF